MPGMTEGEVMPESTKVAPGSIKVTLDETKVVPNLTKDALDLIQVMPGTDPASRPR